MTFPLIAIRTETDNGDPLYPDVPSAGGSYPVLMEPGDGTPITHLQARGLTISTFDGYSLHPLQNLGDLELDVLVTDQRLIVASRAFDKGRTWIGLGPAGLVAGGVLTAVSKARAAQRRRGKTLAGHLRYPWISAVGASRRHGRTGQEAIRLQVTDATSEPARELVLELRFLPVVQAVDLAAHLTQRAAHHRLVTGQASPGDQAALEQLRTTGPVNPAGPEFAFQRLPGHWPITITSASNQPRPNGSSVPASVRPAEASTRFTPGTGSYDPGGSQQAMPAPARRCIRAACAQHGQTITALRCPSCDTPTQLVSR